MESFASSVEFYFVCTCGVLTFLRPEPRAVFLKIVKVTLGGQRNTPRCKHSYDQWLACTQVESVVCECVNVELAQTTLHLAVSQTYVWLNFC